MKTFAASIAIVVCFAVTRPAVHAEGRKVVVVVVARGSSLTSISRADLERCFRGQQVRSGGRALVPFNAVPRTRERVGFDRVVLGMTPDEVDRYWIDRKVRGESGPPRSLPSPVHIAKVVAKIPNAISYVSVEQLSAHVQAVRIDGIPYTDAHYQITQ